mmetsp:Transcript_29867/g.79461  ORF Transcript_29867/g.79461 Transcript_29867/m.79461 type:complete len:205 (+) Transcript_29867:179-793(+)
MWAAPTDGKTWRTKSSAILVTKFVLVWPHILQVRHIGFHERVIACNKHWGNSRMFFTGCPCVVQVRNLCSSQGARANLPRHHVARMALHLLITAVQQVLRLVERGLVWAQAASTMGPDRIRKAGRQATSGSGPCTVQGDSASTGSPPQAGERTHLGQTPRNAPPHCLGRARDLLLHMGNQIAGCHTPRECLKLKTALVGLQSPP